MPGASLTCAVGTWSGTGLAYAIQWLRGKSLIRGQTAPTYRVRSSDVGRAIGCRVTASNALGRAGRTSGAVVVGLVPALIGLRESSRVFAPNLSPRKGGTVFSFRLRQRANVNLGIGGQTAGRRVGVLVPPVYTLSWRGHPGLNRIWFDGYANAGPFGPHGALKPGTYAAQFFVSNQYGMPKARTLTFRIVRS